MICHVERHNESNPAFAKIATGCALVNAGASQLSCSRLVR